MKQVFSLLFIFTAFYTYSQTYRGTIDKYPIVFQFAADAYLNYKARYYYMSTKQDILLYVDQEDSTLLTTSGAEDRPLEKFSLVKKGKTLTGKWMYKGKTLTVNLTEEYEIKNSYTGEELKGLEDYSRIKFENTKLLKLKDEKWDASTVLTWYKEPVSGIECCRIKSSSKIKDIKKVNAFLRKEHFQQARESISCIDGAPNGGEYSCSCRISFLSSELMSLVWSVSYYCGGAHPDAGENARTIDVNTGKEINLRDLYWLSNDAYKQVSDDYGMPGYGEFWQALLNKQYPGEYPPDAEEKGDGCVYTAESWAPAMWYLTEKGLYMGSFFPRAARCCDTWNGEPFVSYKLLEKYRVKSNKYTLK